MLIYVIIFQVKLQGGDWVIKQGQTYNGIYFLITGEVRVILNGQLHVKQYENSKPIDEYEKMIAGNMTTVSLLGHQEVMRSLSQAHVHVSHFLTPFQCGIKYEEKAYQ